MGELDGRRLIITGGGSGIGAATAVLAAHEGARVAVVDLDEAAAERVAGEIDGVGLRADVTDSAAVDAAFGEAADRLGGLDALFNNAGVGDLSPLEGYSDQRWKRLLDVNLSGVFHGIRAAIPLLRAAGGGAIVNMASTSGIRPTRGEAPYAAAKAAVLRLTESAAAELAPEIRVNAVAPGFIATPLTEPATGDDESRVLIESGTPLGRIGRAEEVAEVVVFLLSQRASYVTGVHLAVDGGSLLPYLQTDELLGGLLQAFEEGS